MADTFTYAGKTITAPGILVDTTIGSSSVFQLLPLGTIAMYGASDGGNGDGFVYTFTDMTIAKRLLRGGPLLQALQRAATIGGASGFVAVVLGHKTPATVDLTGAASAAATLSSGDQGLWTNGISVEIIPGTLADSVAVIFSYTDATTGRTVYLGGLKTPFDNILLFSQLAQVIANDNLLTPPTSSGFPPIVTLAVTTDGLPTVMAATNLAGGSGGGASPITFADVKLGVDASITTPFDLAHLVQVYDEPSQAYADAEATLVSGYGNLRRFIHQTQSASASSTLTKVQNSAAIVAAGVTNANALDSIRSSVACQKGAFNDPITGAMTYVDLAPFICGIAALLGATGAQGPATPLTFETIPGIKGVDYEVLETTGDRDYAIQQGVIVCDQIGSGNAKRVRIVQSVTTAPLDGAGNPWVFGEFSVVRVSDAVLANIKVVVEASRPKVIGGGNTRATMTSVLADVRDVLEDALAQSWITAFDPASVTIHTTGSVGMDDIVEYDMAPTLPLNHLGIGQNLLPYSATVSLSGQVSG